jgi:predicted membrane channel-forming protein YqfA (hemolysin III family)
MNRRHFSEVNIQQYYIGFSCLLFGYLFKFLILFTTITGRGECLHVFWLTGEHLLLSPFFLALGCVGLFFLFSFFKLVSGLFRKRREWGNTLFYLILSFVLGVWLHGFNGFWETFEYEKGNLSEAEYYSPQIISNTFWRVNNRPHQCSNDN